MQVCPVRDKNREAGANPEQCRCCVSGVFSMTPLGADSREGRKRRLTLQPEYLPAYDAQKNLLEHRRVQLPLQVNGWFAVPFRGTVFYLPVVCHPSCELEMRGGASASAVPRFPSKNPALPVADVCEARAVLPDRSFAYEGQSRRSGCPS